MYCDSFLKVLLCVWFFYNLECGGCNEGYHSIYHTIGGFGGLGVACWPLVPKFAGSNPAEAVGFLSAKKSSARLPSEGK